MNKKTFSLSTLIVIGFVLIFFSPDNTSDLAEVPESPLATKETAATTTARVETPESLPTEKTATTSRQTTTAPLVSSQPNKQFVLLAGDVHYSVIAPKEATVYESMLLLSSTTPFRFTTKEFSGLGYRVESINGKANAEGTYWTLYINGEYANIGASTYIPKAGDTIEWKYIKL